MSTENQQVNSQRLFFALWPDDMTRTRIAGFVPNITRREGRRVPPENLHATLVFLGSTSAFQRTCVESAAESIRSSPFRLRLDSCGFWPKPRVAWLGARATPTALVELHASLTGGVRACGMQIDSRPFAVHITLVRDAARPVLMEPLVPIDWDVGAFALVESHTHSAGVRYTVLRTWSLFGQPHNTRLD